MHEKLLAVLKQYFGYNSFRAGQEEIITSVLAGQDTLAVMPTGGGKSLCYQIPAMLFHGLTVVVSPLIALMQDQVAQLDAIGIPAVFLNSSLDKDTYRKNMEHVRDGSVKLLYVAPETLATERLRNLLCAVRVDCLTIDEAHCISEWGHDFRPEYRQIIHLRELVPDAVCLALTATATVKVRRDIQRCLGMTSADAAPRRHSESGSRFKEFVSSFNRPNIYLEVVGKTGAGGGKRAQQMLIEFIRSRKEQSGIVYCFSRRQVDELTAALCSSGIEALPYHAGLSDFARAENQTRFVRDDIPVIVATVAFGMGINKPNVRYVIHFDLPKSIEQYYQEIGRAGRDGDAARAVLFYSYADTRKIRFFFKDKTPEERAAAEQQLKAMTDYAECRTCRRAYLLAYFGESYPPNEQFKTPQENGCCDVCDSLPAADTDVTVPVQKLLSCIMRTNERYGAAYIIDVLLGSRRQRILDNGHNRLSTWGIGREYTRDDWFELVRLLTEAGFLRKSEEYGVLSLTRDAKDTLFARGSVYLPFVPSEKRSVPQASFAPAQTAEKRGAAHLAANDEWGQAIFSELRKIRRKLADEAEVPPYVIFSDKTLEDAAVKKPAEKTELLNIYGIGAVKAEKYGEFICRAVKNTAAENTENI
ncbi:MAG: DNA helicase RecQ [Bacteroides sp.]|nr:DNA helicase RecQ [Prevotella sp.]MCM1408066.1 DNA helicase RecQ [Treponema brennaborense]MCM1469042.1 DNA helicase RecQ [Bacteroides sp.]